MGLRGRVPRLEPAPRLVDWSLLAFVLVAAGSGVLSLGSGRPSDWVVFAAHGVVGLTLVVLVWLKLRRVRRRVTDSRAWDRATVVSVLLAAVVVSALATGLFWAFGGNVRVLYWTTLNVHILFGLLAVPLVLAHLLVRARPPRRTDVEGRRTVLQYSLFLLVGLLVWRAQSVVNRLLDTAGARRRFTGSKPVPGSSFPVTSWIADDPDPLDADAWTLSVDGRVSTPLTLAYDDLASTTERQALLDCTSGWYTVQDWRGVRLGDLLDRAGPSAEARWVTVRSVTGYRWSYPIDEAREFLLATHVGGERLSHGHGAPLRLVAPDRRGFQWIKWVTHVEVRRSRDPDQWLAVFVSGFT